MRLQAPEGKGPWTSTICWNGKPSCVWREAEQGRALLLQPGPRLGHKMWRKAGKPFHSGKSWTSKNLKGRKWRKFEVFRSRHFLGHGRESLQDLRCERHNGRILLEGWHGQEALDPFLHLAANGKSTKTPEQCRTRGLLWKKRRAKMKMAEKHQSYCREGPY